jgi:transposase
LENGIREAVPEWSLDLSRFQNPRELMDHLVPSGNSTGDKVKRGGITKADNGRKRLSSRRLPASYPPSLRRALMVHRQA